MFEPAIILLYLVGVAGGVAVAVPGEAGADCAVAAAGLPVPGFDAFWIWAIWKESAIFSKGK